MILDQAIPVITIGSDSLGRMVAGHNADGRTNETSVLSSEQVEAMAFAAQAARRLTSAIEKQVCPKEQDTTSAQESQNVNEIVVVDDFFVRASLVNIKIKDISKIWPNRKCEGFDSAWGDSYYESDDSDSDSEDEVESTHEPKMTPKYTEKDNKLQSGYKREGNFSTRLCASRSLDLILREHERLFLEDARDGRLSGEHRLSDLSELLSLEFLREYEDDYSPNLYHSRVRV